MTVDVTTEAVIKRPRPVVAAFTADPRNAPKWYTNILAVDWVSGPPLAEGARVTFAARFLGRRIEYTYDFVEYEPGVRLVMRTQEGPFPMETSYTWSSIDQDATLMTLRNRGQPAGFARMAAGVIEAAMRRANDKDLARLRSLLEDHQGAEPLPSSD